MSHETSFHALLTSTRLCGVIFLNAKSLGGSRHWESLSRADVHSRGCSETRKHACRPSIDLKYSPVDARRAS